MQLEVCPLSSRRLQPRRGDCVCSSQTLSLTQDLSARRIRRTLEHTTGLTASSSRRRMCQRQLTLMLDGLRGPPNASPAPGFSCVGYIHAQVCNEVLGHVSQNLIFSWPNGTLWLCENALQKSLPLSCPGPSAAAALWLQTLHCAALQRGRHIRASGPRRERVASWRASRRSGALRCAGCASVGAARLVTQPSRRPRL